jgi:hypothetical protein
MTDPTRKGGENAVISHSEIRLRLAKQRREEERREASRYRSATSLPRRSPARQYRSFVGRSLIRLGQRLAGEANRSIQPARSP